MTNKSSNKYLHFIVTAIASTIILIVVSIFYIVDVTFADEKDANYQKAFIWQAKNKGVVGMTVKISNKYKQRMLEWCISEKNVDTILLGSSTMMGIKADMFKTNTIFNGATNSNPLYYTVSVAKYHSKHTHSIKNIIIGFDWALGLPYRSHNNIKYNPLMKNESDTKLVDKIKDAVSYQRFKIVLINLIDGFFTDSSSPYQCPTEDTMGTDQFFETDQPKRCHGFRFDGSVIFPDQTRVSKKKWIDYLNNGLGKYQNQFDTNLGTIGLKYLNDFKEINKNLRKRGGRLIILIPPLIPNATTTMEDFSNKAYISKLGTLLNFSKKNNIDILDASKSEDFGCTHSDFLDAHHSFPSCYEKILGTLSF